MKTTVLLLAATLVIAAASGCGSISMYHGFGHSEELSYPNGATIELRGNRSDRREYAILRAAELTLERGHQYYVVTNSQNGLLGSDGAIQQTRTQLDILMYDQPPKNILNVMNADVVASTMRAELGIGD